MSSTWRLRAWPALLLVALATPVHAQSFGFPWWKDAQFQRDLSLTSEQTAKIDGVFQSSISQLRQKNEELKSQEDELSRLIAASSHTSSVWRNPHSHPAGFPTRRCCGRSP